MLSLWLSLAGFAGVGLAGGLEPPQETVQPADYFVISKVFTADPIQPWADALAVRGDKIVAVGSLAELKPYQGPSTDILREPAGSVVPGFNDAHSHLLVAAALESDLDLAAEGEGKRILEKLAGWLTAHPGDEVLNATGLSASVASDAEFLWRFEHITAGRSVLVWGASTTWCLANQGARARLGLAPEAKRPRGVFWFPSHPSLPPALFAGPLLLETFAPIALGALGTSGEPNELGELERRLALACAQANRVGITSIQEPLPVVLVRVLRTMLEKGTLTLRVHALTAAEGDPDPVPVVPIDPEDIDPSEPLPVPPSAPWLTYGTLELELQEKLLAGAPALTLSGLVRLTDVRARRVALTMGGETEVRRTVEGTLQIVPAALDLYSARNLIVSVQPGALLALADANPAELPYPEAEILPLRSLVERGVTLAFGSDYPLYTLDPLRGVYAAVARNSTIDLTILTRRKRSKADAPDARVYGAGECLSIVEALRAATLDPARAEGNEGSKGILGPGRAADLVLFETNVVDNEPRQLLQPHLRATIVGGRIVHGY